LFLFILAFALTSNKHTHWYHKYHKMGEVEDQASSKNPLNRLRNWEATVRKEMAVAKDWDDNWGFLRAKQEETQKRECDSCLAKYYAKGILGETEATVKTKRLPKAPETEENKEMIMKLSAAREATGQKTGLMTTIAKKDFAGNTSLEMFGVSEYGREKTTKMPGGKSITKHFRYC